VPTERGDTHWREGGGLSLGYLISKGLQIVMPFADSGTHDMGENRRRCSVTNVWLWWRKCSVFQERHTACRERYSVKVAMVTTKPKAGNATGFLLVVPRRSESKKPDFLAWLTA